MSLLVCVYLFILITDQLVFSFKVSNYLSKPKGGADRLGKKGLDLLEVREFRFIQNSTHGLRLLLSFSNKSFDKKIGLL